MTPEQMRERAAEICRQQMRKDRETEVDPALRGVAILTAKELEKAIRTIPIAPTPPDPSAEALKLALETLKAIVRTEKNVARSSIRVFAEERLAEIRKIVGERDGQS